MKTPIKYPTWKVKGTPTPNEALFVHDECGTAVWTQHMQTSNPPQCSSCIGRKGGPKRMREATKAEYAKGKKALKEIIG